MKNRDELTPPQPATEANGTGAISRLMLGMAFQLMSGMNSMSSPFARAEAAHVALRDACRVQPHQAVAPVITAQYLDAVTGPAPAVNFAAAPLPAELVGLMETAEIVGGIVIGEEGVTGPVAPVAPADLNATIARLFTEVDHIVTAVKEARRREREARTTLEDVEAERQDYERRARAKTAELTERLVEFREKCPPGQWIAKFKATFGCETKLRTAQRLLERRNEDDEARQARLAAAAAAKKQSRQKKKQEAAASSATDTADVCRAPGGEAPPSGHTGSNVVRFPGTGTAGSEPANIGIEAVKASVEQLSGDQLREFQDWYVKHVMLNAIAVTSTMSAAEVADAVSRFRYDGGAIGELLIEKAEAHTMRRGD
jgi:hypothetical protein